MARYEARFRKSVAKDLNPIPKKDVQRIIAIIDALADNPRPPQSRKLSGSEKHRLRRGVYRVLYEIQDNVLVVCVVKVGHRKDVYRNLIEPNVGGYRPPAAGSASALTLAERKR